jgi:Ser/Thr protein kinase RdoA (MazF antagonist)
MTHFPVTNSNLSPNHLATFLREKYNFGQACGCKLIRAGINDTYLVTNEQDKYVFRIYSLGWRTEMEISEEIRLLNKLKENEVSISYPLVDAKGHYIQTLNAPEGNRPGVLFSFADGEKISHFPEETHYRIGVLMARLHQVTVNMTLQRINYTSKVILENPFLHLEKFLSADSDEMRFMQSTQKYLLNEFSKADTAHLRNGAVHLDIWFDNLNIDQEKNVTIFDFDFCGNGWLCLDIAYYILQIHNIEKYEAKDYQPKIDQFIQGYESITPITDEEKRLVPMLGVSLYFFYLGIQCQRYDNWSNTFLSENYLKRFINGLVKRYFEIHSLG